MNVHDWLTAQMKLLSAAGIATARLDCLVLLEDAAGKDRAWLLAHPEFKLPTEVVNSLNSKVSQRTRHVPLAYIRGRSEFYGREFIVNECTLVPRPETETMIGLLKQAAVSTKDRPLQIGDIGTGSGAIAATAKLELPDTEVVATDIDKKCLETARANARRLSADIAFRHGNLLEPFYNAGRPAFTASILLCNLPYVPDNFQINTAATHEPRHALFGGSDGLDLYRELFAQTKALPHTPQYIFCESLPPQHETLAGIAQSAGYRLRRTEDFIQLFSYGGSWPETS